MRAVSQRFRNLTLVATIVITSSSGAVAVAPGYSVSGPVGGLINGVTGVFTVTPRGTYSGRVVITPSGAGLSTPIVLTFGKSSAPQTFSLRPTAVGPLRLTPTNTGGLLDPPALIYATPPSAPAIASIMPGDRSATVSITPPATNGGADITTYTTTCNPGGNTSKSPISPVSIGGLVNGATYTCWVVASNAIGVGASSEISRPVIPVGPASTITSIQSLLVPAHGNDYTLFNSQNVFSLTDAGTYPDGTSGDWIHWVATANDKTAYANGIFYNAQEITIRNKATSPKISVLTYSGVPGPSLSLFGSNSYFDWSSSDNDNSEIDYSGPYFSFVGNGFFSIRPFGSSYTAMNCADSAGRLVVGCAAAFTVRPPKSGPQNLYVWVRTAGANASISVSSGSDSKVYNLPIVASASSAEHLVTIALSPSDTATLYSVRIAASSIQTGATDGLVSVISAAIGGAKSGNVSDEVLASVGYVGTPSHSYGVRVHQVDPASRIPTAAHVRSLSIGESLQSAIAGALCGTDLHLPRGYVSNERIVLPNKGCSDSAWIRIIADGAKNSFGQRAAPVDYPGGSLSPAILNWSGPEPVISNDSGNPDPAARAAHHYAFVGVEVTAIKSTSPVNWALVSFNAGQAPTVQSISHDIVLQGCYIHRHVSQENSINGIEFNVDRGAIYDSYISGFQGNRNSYANENHAIYFDSTNGPLTIRNNFLSAATECLLTGGVPASPFVITKDVEIDGNFFDKPLALNSQPYPPYDVKNSLEFKQGQFVSVTNNVFEHGFAGYGQIGTAVYVRNMTFGVLQKRTTSNFRIANNIVRHHTVGFQIESYDYFGLGGPADGTVYPAKVPMHFVPRQYDIEVSNNLMEDFSAIKWGAVGRGWSLGSNFFYIGNLPVNLTIDHNTGTFDTATDNASGYQDSDHSILVAALGTLSRSEGTALTGCAPSANNAPNEAITSFHFSNNVLGGGIHGDCSAGTYLMPTAATYSNNLFFNLPGYIANTFGSRVLSGMAYTTSPNPDVSALSNQGVNRSALPNDCKVITGNRSDLSCISGQ